MTQPCRLPSGGIVDRAQPLPFEFDGVAYEGLAGDTLAAALLANGKHLVGRGFKYHRPRGIAGAGVDEPNAFVRLGRDARTEPNVRATTQELFTGLEAASQNCWPSVRLDVGAINGFVSRLIPAGFYYKTFMWPPTPKWWLRYERVIRHAAGVGRVPTLPDPDAYEHQYAHCDVLVVGAGPAGLEAARALGQRGYRVMLAEARRELGGRVLHEASLPGLNEWRRVADWRIGQLQRMANVEVYRDSPMMAADIAEVGAANVILATGSTYRRDGIGRTLWRPVSGHNLPNVLTPDDIFAGAFPTGRVVIYDDDHYVMGGLLAELCAQRGCNVTLVTPAPLVSHWTQYSLEQRRIEARLRALGVTILTRHTVSQVMPDAVTVIDNIAGTESHLPADGVLLVTDRTSNDDLYRELEPALADGRLRSLRVIGDAEAPGLIAQAVFSGHLAAREFGEASIDGTPFSVERVRV